MKLTKIRLINWHIFNDHTIRLNGNVVFTGENGNGKSTLIDAIYFVLSGGDEYHFNNAANAESARTLNTYVRCKLGIEGKEFKRNENDVIGHVALQFENQYTHEIKTLGCVIELSGSKAKKYFYILHDVDVDDVVFVDNKVVADYETLKKVCGKSFETLGGQSGTQRNIRSRIEDLLQLSNGENYYTLLKKAIAFVPLNQEITSFVNTFLLKEDKININDLKQEIDSYRDIQKTLTREKAKLTCLESFVNVASEYQNNLKRLKYLNAISYKQHILTDGKTLESKKKEQLTMKDEITTLERKEAQAVEHVDKYKDIIREYQNNDTYKALLTNKDKLAEKNENLKYAIGKQDKYDSMLQVEQNIADDLKLRYKFLRRVENGDIVALNQDLQAYLKDLTKIENEQNHIKFVKDNERIENNKKIIDLNTEISNLLQGQNRYKENVTNLIETIQDKLSDKHNKPIKVLPMCECFEIVDKKWTNAIEGYMSNQRFDLIVEKKYFNEALKIYDQVAERERIYEVGLVDTTKQEDLPVFEDSLFTKIKINNPYVETKLKQLLGQVVCVENINELTNYKAAITPSCMLYKNYVAKRLSPERYSQHFIGVESQKQRVNFLTVKRDELRIVNRKIQEEIDETSEILSVIKQSRFNKEDSIPNIWFEVESLKQEIEEIEFEIKAMEDNDDLVGINTQIEDYEKKLLVAMKEKDEARAKLDAARVNMGIIIEKIKSTKLILQQSKENYDLEVASNELNEDYFEFEKNFFEGKKFSLIDEKNLLTNKNAKFEKVIKDGILAYHTNFEKNLGSSIDDLDKYIAKYNQIMKTDIVNFEQKATEAYENAKRSFNEKFVSTLRVKIRKAQANLDAINKVLDKHPFGLDEERYSFSYGPSQDKELGNYYRVIASDKAYNKIDLLVESLPEADQDIIKELFERIATDQSDTLAAQRLEDCLDYRKYMKYDIKIVNKNNDSFLFSKIAKEKSGGETQTPFYIVIAACFEELLRKGEADSSCMIIFDEAFNNMDESRIATLLDYYNKLTHIQFMIGVPTNRAPLLAPSMDTCIGLIKSGTNVDLVYIKDKDN